MPVWCEACVSTSPEARDVTWFVVGRHWLAAGYVSSNHGHSATSKVTHFSRTPSWVAGGASVLAPPALRFSWSYETLCLPTPAPPAVAGAAVSVVYPAVAVADGDAARCTHVVHTCLQPAAPPSGLHRHSPPPPCLNTPPESIKRPSPSLPTLSCNRGGVPCAH